MRPPTLKANAKMRVKQNDYDVISKQKLRVVHDEARSRDILYHVTEWPKMGDLQLEVDDEEEGVSNVDDNGDLHGSLLE